MAKCLKAILFLLIWCFIDSEARISNYQFTAINDCTCPGYDSLYQCTVTGGIATIWKGTIVNCRSSDNEVILLHNTNFTSLRTESCNNGAITGRAIRVENNTYISQLIVRVSADMNGSTIDCAHDTGVGTPVIGSTLLTITKDPFPSPMDIKLMEENNTHLSFIWSQEPLNCPSIQYKIIVSENCGECPNTTTSNKVTCTRNYTQLTNNHQCSFAVQTVVCDDIIGDFSSVVNVTMTASGIRSTNNKSSISSSMCIQGAGVSSSVVPFGTVTGAMSIVIVFIISIFTASIAILIKSKRALRVELDVLKAKMKEPVIYEEIAQLQDSLKSSSPTIDVGENIAYESAISVNVCTRTST